ncbi:hypothetical protein HA41_00720 [Pantoea conspicua]|uniref:Tail spike TSP1/Gp66 N-terminal domain-containing protein n=1 Tax=Pantoea conspicua TaxID=472705 RepID=A0A1X1C2T6_9GAMM|nr:hypothetical protein [Pantoea conspicua]ORM55987.1 hypothetical protein HA41_00720 [Pantoea conspicua]
MATQPTQNQVPSESPRDLKFNAGKVDEFVSSSNRTYTDRLGNEHYTIEGLNYLSQQAMKAFGYVILNGKSFTTGATISNPNEILFNPADGEYYKWTGSFASGPKVVPENSTPASSGGEGAGKWLTVGDSALRSQLIDGFADILVEQPKTGNFWIDVHPEAKIHRQNDRLFIGAAADNDGKISSTPSSSTKDWMELIRPATTNNAQFAVLSTIGQGAVLGASRSSDFASAGSLGCIGLSGYGINDNTAFPQTAYGAYLEAQRFAGAGRTHGFELDIVNFGSAVGIQPYDMFQDGLTVGGWIASGAEFSSTKASAALAIINNGAPFDKGIVFHSTSLAGTDGITGAGVAIEMAKNQAMRWMFGAGDLGASLTSGVSNPAATQQLAFTDSGMLFRNRVTRTMFRVDVSDTYVNGLEVIPANAGFAAAIQATGTDTNIDVALTPKGTGVVKINNPQVSAGAGAQQGYFQIRLANTLYKIPYYAV